MKRSPGSTAALFWDLAYALGLTPWDTGVVPPELDRLLADGTVAAPGSALDVGCGTGTNSVFMARHGLDVLGVDVSRVAIRRARRRSRRDGVDARFQVADVTGLHLSGSPARPGYKLILDVGCFHGLGADGRRSYAEMVGALLGDGGYLLQYVRLAGPRRASRAASLRSPSRAALTVLLQGSTRRSRPPHPTRPEVEAVLAWVCDLLEVAEGVEGARPATWFLWRARER